MATRREFLASVAGATMGRVAVQAPTRRHLKPELFIDSMVLRRDGLRQLIAEVGAGQMVYCTDDPFDRPVGSDVMLNASFLSDADKTAIPGGNVIKALRPAS